MGSVKRLLIQEKRRFLNMGRINKCLAILVLCVAAVSVVMGSVFIYQGVAKETWMRGLMRQEKVTYGLPEEKVKAGEVLDTPEEAQNVALQIGEHRRVIAPTYEALLGGGKFDPTNPKHLTYAQALNMENYLWLAVLGAGVTQIAEAVGAFMIITGIGLGGTGVVLLRLTRRIS
jgi:hypothetical protein